MPTPENGIPFTTPGGLDDITEQVREDRAEAPEELAEQIAASAAMSGSYMAYVGNYTTPISDAGTARPDTPGPVYWICENGVTPSNAEDGDLVWNAA